MDHIPLPAHLACLPGDIAAYVEELGYLLLLEWQDRIDRADIAAALELEVAANYRAVLNREQAADLARNDLRLPGGDRAAA